MGDEISKDHFTPEDYQLFRQKLEAETVFVRELFAENRFDNQTHKLGYELELCLIEGDGSPAPLNKQILEKANNPLFTYELAKYNLEINGNAFDVCPDVFAQIDRDLTGLYQQVKQAAESCHAQVGFVGRVSRLRDQ